MNRIQFYILTGLSSLVVLLLIGQILLARQVSGQQNILSRVQQAVNESQVFQNNLKQLAVRIYQDSQKTQDQGLKDLLARQQISYRSAASGSADTATPAPAPSSTTPTTTTH